MKNKKSFKKILMIFILILTVFTISGCGENDPAKGKTKIVFWTPPFPELATRQWLEKWTDKYNQINEDNVYIDLVFIAEDAWDQTLKAAQASGDAPQITFESYADTIRGSMVNKYLALDELLPQSAWDDLYDNVLDLVKGYEGKKYIYPAFTEPYSILFYRKSLLNKQNIEVPQSWDDLYEAAKKLTTKNTYGVQLPPSAQLAWAVWGFQAQADSYLLNDNWDTAVVNTEFNRQLFNMWKKINDESLTPKVSQESYTMVTPLATGKVAMQLGGSWMIGQLKNDYPNILNDIGIAPAPTINGITKEVTTAAMGGWGIAIDSLAKNPVEAARFIEYLLAGEQQICLEFFKSTGFSKLSGRKSVDELILLDSDAINDPFRKILVEDIAPYAKAEPVYLWEISSSFATSLESTYLTNITIEKALTDLNKKITDYIIANELAGTNPKKQK